MKKLYGSEKKLIVKKTQLKVAIVGAEFNKIFLCVSFYS